MRSSKAALVLLSCALFAAGCATAQPESETSAPDDAALEASAQPGGESLYRGMVFGVGPAARLFPEIWQSEAIQSKVTASAGERERAADHVVAYITQRDPTFFERFGQDMTSGDREAIAAMLEETRDQTGPAAKDYVKVSGQQSGRLSPGEDRGLSVWVAGDYLVAYDVAVIAVAVAIFAFAVTPADGNRTHIENDAWVDALAKRDMRLPALH